MNCFSEKPSFLLCGKLLCLLILFGTPTQTRSAVPSPHQIITSPGVTRMGFGSVSQASAVAAANPTASPATIAPLIKAPATLTAEQAVGGAAATAAGVTAVSGNVASSAAGAVGLTTGQAFTASMIAAAFETTITFPLRALKISKQLEVGAASGAAAAAAAATTAAASPFAGFTPTFATGLMRQGTMFFTGSLLVGSADSMTEQALSAMAAGAISAVVSSPGSNLLSRIRKEPHVRPGQMIQRMVHKEGAWGFFRGVKPLMAKSMTGALGYFFIPQLLTPILDNTTAVMATSGLLTAAMTQPLDVLKTQMQVRPKGTSIRKVTSDIIEKNGPAGLWRGVPHRMVNTTIGFVTANAIMAMVGDYFLSQN